MDKINFYQLSDFAKLEEYVKENTVNDAYVEPKVTYPFSLELVISYLVDRRKDKYFCFAVLTKEYGDVHLRYAHKHGLRVDILDLATKEYLSFIKYELLQKGEITSRLGKYKAGPVEFSVLSKYFDPNMPEDPDVLRRKNYVDNVKGSIYEIFPEFSFIGFEWKLPKKIKSGKRLTHNFAFTDDRDNWDDVAIATLFLNNKENTQLLSKVIPRVFEFSQFVIHVTNLNVKLTVSDSSIDINLALNCDLYTLEDYWITIGLYYTKLDALSKSFDKNDLLEWLAQWNANDCNELRDMIDRLRWNDVKNLL